MRLYLVRHGRTAWNVQGLAQGHTDEPLDAVGLAQARRLAAAMSEVALGRLVSSDLMRARQTAEALGRAQGLEPEFRADLRERFMGDWEGRHFLELREFSRKEGARLGIDPLDVDLGGESDLDVWNRLAGFQAELALEQRDTAVVLHGLCGSLLLSRLIRATPETGRSMHLGNASITELLRRPEGRWQLVRFDDIAHLEGVEDEVAGAQAAGPVA